MANPNIATTTSILGRTELQAVGTSATAIASNGSSSNKVLKVNTLVIANVAASDVDVTVDVFRGGTARRLANAITIPPNSSLAVLAKENPLYLLEGDDLRLTASAVSRAEALCSFEEIG